MCTDCGTKWCVIDLRLSSVAQTDFYSNIHLQNNVILESARSAQEVSQFRAQLAAVEGSVRKCAGLHNVETLGAVVEEQRLRLDSLILGAHL